MAKFQYDSNKKCKMMGYFNLLTNKQHIGSDRHNYYKSSYTTVVKYSVKSSH